MANGDITPSRLGLIEGGTDADALFLKVFSGEVLTAFHNMNVMVPRTYVRTITSGKSAQFPVTGKASAYYHTPGAELVGQQIPNNERIITIDDLLVAPVFIASIDEAKEHYDVRSIFTNETGQVLANAMDRNIQQVSILAARSAANVSTESPGHVLNLGTDLITNANSALTNGIYSAAQALDEANVLEDGRFAVFRPAQYWLLVRDPATINRDFNSGTMVDRAKGKVYDIGGVEIVKSNQLPRTNVTTGPTAYQGDFSLTYGIVQHMQAAGTVKLMDLATEGEYETRRQGTLIVSKYACGHGILRPECAVELSAHA